MKIVDHQTLVDVISVKLKGKLVPPNWASYVKTGHGKQRPPINQDWWYVRAAAVLLSVQKLGPVGVSKLSVKYGGRKNKGMQPEKFANASRNILRKILQQLESLGYIKQAVKDVHKGRIVTTSGVKFINDCSKEAAVVKKESKSVIEREKERKSPIKSGESSVPQQKGNQRKDQKDQNQKDGKQKE